MTQDALLSIRDLTFGIDAKPIIQEIHLTISPGEIHLLLGPNGAGKSTLGHFLAGKPGYKLQQGEVTFGGEDLLAMAPEERVHRGLLMAFQQPISIPGVSNMHFLATAINETRKGRGQAPLKAPDALKQIQHAMQQIGLDRSFLSRSVNEDFSGGERKKNELLQIMLLAPKLVILDETDAGLDPKSRQRMHRLINQMRKESAAFLLITHYAELLHEMAPHAVHVMERGRLTTTQSIASALGRLSTKSAA